MTGELEGFTGTSSVSTVEKWSVSPEWSLFSSSPGELGAGCGRIRFDEMGAGSWELEVEEDLVGETLALEKKAGQSGPSI